MHYSVDVNREYQKVKSKFLRLALLFSFILTAVIVADVLLILLSKENYMIELIIAIVLSILFTWFAIYFFTNIYVDVNNRYRYFKGYENGLKPVDEVIFLEHSDEISYVNGLYVYPLIVKYVDNLAGTDKIIYSFDKINLEKGDKLTITTYQRIILKADQHE